MKRVILLIGLILNTILTFAQASVDVKIDPIEMMIGEQAQVTMTVHASEGAKVEMPTFQPRQQIVAGVEVINVEHPTDHSLLLTLTSFDGNLYYLPPFKVKVNGKTLESKSLALKVVEVEVDTTYLRLRDNKPIIARIKIVKRLLPHQKAMKEIEQIKADKMVSSENQKEYYTKLTDTLRKYIEERYGFSAMEMTSTEIIERLMASDDQQSLSELRQLFMTADLVKFAKYSTMINENDANLVNAIDFINQTKLENQPTEETVKPQLSEEDQRSQKTRRILKALIWTVITISTLLFCYVIYSIYQLLN